MNPIDRIIKEKLEGLEAPFDAGSWQLMEQKLDEEAMGMEGEGQPVADTKHVDETVFEKLHNYEAGYQPGHWQRMEALLEEVFAWPRQVLRYKLIELSLMLLLFLFLWQYTPAGPAFGTTRTPAPQAQQTTPLNSNTTPDEKGQAINSKEQGHIAPQASIRNEDASKQATSTERDSDPTQLATSAGAGNNINNKAADTAPEAPTGSAFSLPVVDEPAPSQRLLSIGRLNRTLPALNAPTRPLPPAAGHTSNTFAVIDWLEALSIEEVAYEGFRDIGDVSFSKRKNRPTFRVGMFGSGEYNHITVPSSEEKKLEEELNRYAIGYGGGLSFGLEFGRFEVETGAIYAAREYPVGLVYVNGSVGSGLQGQRLEASELNIINLPLHFRYSFLRRGGWRAYALAGASLQVAFQRNYYVSEEPQFDFRPMQPPPAPAPAGDEPTIDRIRKSGLGWFEGGTFEENAYLTGNVGIGLERYISSRWSLFVQPTYQHSLQYFRVGLGPNADRINSLSFLFGAKVQVK